MERNKNLKVNTDQNNKELVKTQLRDFRCVQYVIVYLFNLFVVLKAMYFVELVLLNF